METKFKTVDSQKFNQLVADVKENTSYNCHSEALVEIADFFGYREYYNMFKAYAEKEGITPNEFKERYEINDRMFFIIQSEYGSDIVTRLNEVM